MPSKVDQLLFELTNLPPEVDPFLWLSAFLKSTFVPRYSSSARAQLYLVIVIHGLCVPLILCSLFLRYRKGQFWLFRWTLSRRLIQPNLAIIPACAAIVEIALFEVLLIGVLDVMGGTFPAYYGYFILLVGLLPAVVGELVTWSIAAAFILHLHATVGSTPALRRWAIVCNIVGTTFPILHLVSFLPIDYLVGRAYENAVGLYHFVDDYLLSQSVIWVPGSPFNIASLLPIISISGKLENSVANLKSVWRIAYAFHSVAASLLIMSLSAIASLYLLSVGRIIQRAKQEVGETGRGGETLVRVGKTWALLLVVLLMFLLLAGFSLGLSLFAATHPLVTSQSYVFISFWSSGILSLMCSTLLLIHTYLGGGHAEEEVEEEKPEGGLPKIGFAAEPEGRTKWSKMMRQKKKSVREIQRGQSRGVTSISVVVEVFSRVDSLEPEDLEEAKPRWTDGRVVL